MGSFFRPRDYQGQVLRKFGLNLRYLATLAGRNRALKLNYGDHNLSFQVIYIFTIYVYSTNCEIAYYVTLLYKFDNFHHVFLQFFCCTMS